MLDIDAPEPEIETSRAKGISWVWLMPLIAVLISAGVVWQTYRDQGPIIVVAFSTASGIEAGRTSLRYRDVEVGVVETIEFTEGLRAVEAHIRVHKDVAPYIDDEAEFWLAEPRVTTRGVSGLDTVLSGVYIAATWDSEIGEPQDRFTALSDIPLAAPGEQGTRVVLRSITGGQLATGAPVLFNGIEVGRLGEPELSPGGTYILTEAFIQAPHDARLTTATRFWDVSGISVDLGTSGLSINFDSLASLIEGGVSFGTFVTGGARIADGHQYIVSSSLQVARQSAFERPIEQALSMSVILPVDDLRLAEGAVVRFRGLRVGEVTEITGFVDPEAPEAGVQMLVTFDMAPDRIGLTEADTREDLLANLQARVAEGLRVRVASEGLLGTSLILELVDLENTTGGEIDFDKLDTPVLPATLADVTESSASLDAIVARVAALPLEQLMGSAIDLLDSVNSIAATDEVRALPANVNELFVEARALVASEDIRATIAQLSGAAGAVDALIRQISESDGVNTALSALEESDAIIASIQEFTDGLPPLLLTAEALVQDLRDVPVTELTVSADQILRRIDAILGSEETEELPATLNAALGELAGVLRELREGDAAQNLAGALGSANEAFAALQAAAEQFPTLVGRLDGLVVSLQGLSRDYSDDSAVYREIRAAIRDITGAADAFRSLARSIERNPNSLLTGR